MKKSYLPRDIVQGVTRAFVSVTGGLLTSFGLFISLPVGLTYHSGLKGGIIGGILGSLLATVVAAGTFIHGSIQLLAGLIRTPWALWAHYSFNRWDSDAREWIANYTLYEEEKELEANKYRSAAVQDATYYEVLDLPTDATAKQIKRAYFQRAKEVHPDKNPGDEKATAKFLELHKAYQTLIDEGSREQYDRTGSTAGDGLPFFDVHLFFTILFGSSQIIESYIGNLKVTSFLVTIMEIYQTVSNTDNISQPEQMSIFLDRMKDYSSGRKEKQRQVDIAIHLWKQIESFVTGNGKRGEEVKFQLACQQEAQKIAAEGTSHYKDIFLEAIGYTLKHEAGIFTGLHNPLGLPIGLIYGLNGKRRNYTRIYNVARRIVTICQTLSSKLNDDEKENMMTNERSAKLLVLLEDQLQDIMEVAWAYVVYDISITLQGAISRLLTANDLLPGKRFKRAKAIQILGDAFLSHAKEVKDSNSHGNTANDDAKARIRIAFTMAVTNENHGKTNKNYEDMVEQEKRRQEQQQQSSNRRVKRYS